MADIVERLRETVQILATNQMNLSMEDWDKVSNAVLDAAGTIKRLRGDIDNAAEGNERLRAALQLVFDELGYAMPLDTFNCARAALEGK